MADFYPHFSFEGDAPGYNRSINAIVQDDGSIQYKPQSQASSSASLTITQQLPWTGGEISLLSGISRIDLINSKSSYYRSSPLSLRYRQPIFQLNTMKWNITSEDLRIQIAEREYEEALEDIAIDITNKFFDAYTARMNVENASFNLSINDTLYQITQGRFNVGKVAENDLLQSELAVMNARTQLANASLQFERAIENLRFAIGFSDEKELSLVPPSTIPIVEVTQELALEQARQNRSDVVNYELLSMNAERSVEQAEYNNSFNA
jgi:outer membrane protein TolC